MLVFLGKRERTASAKVFEDDAKSSAALVEERKAVGTMSAYHLQSGECVCVCLFEKKSRMHTGERVEYIHAVRAPGDGGGRERRETFRPGDVESGAEPASSVSVYVHK